MLKNLLKLSLVLSLCLPNLVLAQTKQKISLLLHNGKVFTADEKFTIVEAVAVDGERIVAVGTSQELKAKYQAAKEIDLRGRLVTPGFNDAHIHFLGGGLSLLRVDLNGAKTLAEAKLRIAAKMKDLPKGAWVLGRGWDHTLWNNRLPTRQDLDDIAPENPVFLQRVDGHIAWANSLALKLAGVTKDTKAPEGGEIVREASGEATGILKETAQSLVNKSVPEPTGEEKTRALEIALTEAKRFGITSIHDISGYASTLLYRELLKQNKLTVRVAEMLSFEDSVEKLKQQRTEFAGFKDDKNRLKIIALKGYVDGTLGSRTAAMLAPYHDDANNSGIPRRSPEELTRMIVERDVEGFQIALHAIGDKANRMALDGFESAFNLPISARSLAKESKRHRIEHAQVIAPTDFKRFAELGVIASMQPTHAISDKRWAGERLGEYRVLGAYSWHLMKSYDVHVPFGTDFPVEAINPYATLYAAVSRQDAGGEPIGGWQPQEKLTMAEAIRCHTYESAYAEFAEKEKGEIKAGMLADLVVQSKDLLTIEPKEILTTEPVYTIFNGAIVYSKAETRP